jgi:hypothetical protein
MHWTIDVIRACKFNVDYRELQIEQPRPNARTEQKALELCIMSRMVNRRLDEYAISP